MDNRDKYPELSERNVVPVETAGSPRTARRRGRCRAAVAALALGALLAASAGCSADTAGSSASFGADEAASTGASPTVDNDLQTAYQDTVKKVLPSVVQITAAGSLGS